MRYVRWLTLLTPAGPPSKPKPIARTRQRSSESTPVAMEDAPESEYIGAIANDARELVKKARPLFQQADKKIKGLTTIRNPWREEDLPHSHDHPMLPGKRIYGPFRQRSSPSLPLCFSSLPANHASDRGTRKRKTNGIYPTLPFFPTCPKFTHCLNFGPAELRRSRA